MSDPETGCTEQELTDAELQALWLEEQAWREMEERMEWLKEMEKARGE
jgi:hypothetical protein